MVPQGAPKFPCTLGGNTSVLYTPCNLHSKYENGASPDSGWGDTNASGKLLSDYKGLENA
jgi:hypothetical protein